MGLLANPLTSGLHLRQDDGTSEPPSPVINLKTIDQALDGLTGFFLGLVYGMLYTPSATGQCYSSCETSTLLLQSLVEELRQFYIPSMWGYFIEDINNLVDMISSITYYCEVQSLIDVVGTLISVEGALSLVGSAGGSYIFTIP